MAEAVVIASATVIPGSECEACGTVCKLYRVAQGVQTQDSLDDEPVLEADVCFGWAECTSCDWVGFPQIPVGRISLN